ncbi:MAG: hypothetical protein MJZ76_00640 [Bacteroidales bacterium]|nr:hypothetical protein [Bacteroidales bacterium]
MKKLMLLAGIAAFVFASCCNKTEEVTAPEEPTCAKEEHKCCGMSEEQKQACADWKNFENLDETRQEELLAKHKECYDNQKAERDAHMAKMAEIDAKMANWDNMTIAEKKAVFDEMAQLCPKHKCHHHHPKGDCPKGECPKKCEEKACPKAE